MKITDLIAQLEASANLSSEEDPEVIVANEDEEDTNILEVSYNSYTNKVDILTYDRSLY